MIELFVTYTYQPFFNILVGIYWLLSRLTPEPDMGLAVIIFAVIIRLILLPLTLAGSRSTHEKYLIAQKIKQLQKDLASDPVRLKQEQKAVLKSHPAAIISESITIFIQLVIVLMLYRIFKTGLMGADFHLLYDFMPAIPQPLNLKFLGLYDLTQPNVTLNLIQSLAILVFESLNMFLSPYPLSRREFISLGVFLPVVSYLIFALLPAGKKLFIITTVCFSILVLLVKQLKFWYYSYLVPAPEKQEQSS